MTLPALFAFLHHVAAFTLVAALAVEFVLIREEITLPAARRLLLADLVYGAAAGSVLAVGLLRVFFFEKGPYYYLHSAPFIAKGGQAGPAAASGCGQDSPHPLADSLGAGSCRGADLLRRPHGERHRRSCLTCA